MRIGMVAGEASGDLLGGALLHALCRQHGPIDASGVGGDNMRAAGLATLAPMHRLSVMGYVDPLLRLPELLLLRRRLRRHYHHTRPNAFVGIDAPDFNLALEQALREDGIPTAHYVSPAVWAWRQRRLPQIRRAVDVMLTVFPFETEYYARHGIEARYVGHPLADQIPLLPDRGAARKRLALDANALVVAVLPGSRRGEISRLASPFFDACELCLRRHPEMQFMVPAANTQAHVELEAIIARRQLRARFTLLHGKAHTAMEAADLVLTASGTATLEAMLYKRPMVVAYRMAPVSYAIVSRMLQIPHVALPNILAGEELVPELMQSHASPQRIAGEMLALLGDTERNKRRVERFAQIHRQLRCDAAAGAARAIGELIEAA